MKNKKYTNLDAIIEMATGEEPLNCLPNYLECPYMYKPDCAYDGGNDKACCFDCKAEWLEEEWEG